MCRYTLKYVILLSVVCLWTGESLSFFASDLLGAPDVCSSEVELEFDQDDLEAKSLPVGLASCTVEFVLVSNSTDHYILISELLSESRWHLRGPPIG